jgi:hypothetical protein
VISEFNPGREANLKIRITPNSKSAIVAMLFFAAIIKVRADTITVTNTNDNGPGSLRQALADAADGDTIDFAITGTIGLTGGELVVDSNVTVSGPGANFLEVSRDEKADPFRVFHVMPSHTVTIENLAVSNGIAAGDVPDGGGIYNDHATLTVNNCAVSSNAAEASGGGICNEAAASSSSLQIGNSVLSGNFALEGAGICNRGTSAGTASLHISNSTLSGNFSPTGFGGGIYNVGSDGNATVAVTNSTLSANSVGASGGAIYNFGFGSTALTLTNCTISENSAQQFGGGIANNGSGSATLEITNSTLSDNSAVGPGGGIYNAQTLAINNSTFSDNSAKFIGGGGIYNFGGNEEDATVDLANTILKAGAAGENILNASGTVTSHGYNLSSDDGGGYLTGLGDQINTNPLLSPLQDNGGPTFTHELFPGSPAIDAGDPSFTPPPFYDQRGPNFYRVRNGRIDIGSFEVQAGTLPPRATPRPRPTPRVRPTPP